MKPLLIVAFAVFAFAVFAPATALATDGELAEAQASCERWELAFVRHWGRWALASACLSGRDVVRVSAPAVDPGEDDPAVWRAAARWFRTAAAKYRRLAPALVRRITRPGTRRLAAWRPCAEWMEAHNPASENTAADARDVLRELRRLYGPRPRLMHPLRVMRALDRQWFAGHERHRFPGVVVGG